MPNTIQTVKRKEVPDLIRELAKRGARPIEIAMRTEIKMRRTHRDTGEENPFGEFVEKRLRISCFINFNYEHSVNLQRIREIKNPDFQTEENWFYHFDPTCAALLVHAGDKGHAKYAEKYIQLKVQKWHPAMFYGEDCELIEDRELFGYLPERTPSTKQQLDKMVEAITVKINNLFGFVADGVEYVVR